MNKSTSPRLQEDVWHSEQARKQIRKSNAETIAGSGHNEVQAYGF